MQQPSKNTLALIGLTATGDWGPLTAYTSTRGKIVWFDKTNPLSPPSIMQRKMRNAWRLYASAWRALTPDQRAAWLRAAVAARLRVTGYNLWIYWLRTRDAATIQTIERRTGESLI